MPPAAAANVANASGEDVIAVTNLVSVGSRTSPPRANAPASWPNSGRLTESRLARAKHRASDDYF